MDALNHVDIYLVQKFNFCNTFFITEFLVFN